MCVGCLVPGGSCLGLRWCNLKKRIAVLPRKLRQMNITRLFVLANLSLFVVVAVFWLYPPGDSWVTTRRFISRQRQVYASYTLQIQGYSGDLEIIQPARRVLPYADLTAAMDEIYALAQYHGLITAQFTAAVPIYDAYFDDGVFVEVMVLAMFTGPPGNAAKFIDRLADGPAFIRAVRMDFANDDAANMRVEFSLFGWEE